MHYNFIILHGDLDGFLQDFFSDGWVKVDDIEADEVVLVLVFNAVEPFYNRSRVYPLVDVQDCSDTAADFVQDGFADESNFTLSWVDESAW